ncbi:CU044_5270 family protein [Actinomadura barringtoniae]|uniref:CU044_5270 family protein n=1 Tax=Actinomadura barringtoniae TaxID=1427535 RepID=A0A939T523_9ACTN|nr:CU044_5270 family protein [Actinomadura barringtoniae]MBO2450113.1 CU044_5270 family protein [Actinomadura barringtoniae]
MNDDVMTAMRETLPAGPPDDPAVKARAWARLHAEFDAPPVRPRASARRTRRRLMVGGVVAVTAGAIVATQVGTTPAKTPQAGGESGSADLRILEVAAKTVENQTAPRPKPDQWIYVPELIVSNAPWARNGKATMEQWWRFDGTKTADYDAKWKKVTVHDSGLEGDDRSPRQFYDYVNGLPTETGALLTRLRKDSRKIAGNNQNERLFGQIFVIFRDAPIMPPKVNAALFRALAKIPGVRIEKNITDLAGRPGIAVTRDSDIGREELILDPRTYDFMGSRTVATRDRTITSAGAPKGGSPQGAKPPSRRLGESTEVQHVGQVLINIAYLPSKVVDKPGDR